MASSLRLSIFHRSVPLLSAAGKDSITKARRLVLQSFQSSQKFSSCGSCNNRLTYCAVQSQRELYYRTNSISLRLYQPFRTNVLVKPIIFTRNVNFFSKKGKRKTVKSVTKRFKRLGSGALKRWKAGKNHNMRKKSHNQKRRLRKPVIVKGRKLRKLNQMISGW